MLRRRPPHSSAVHRHARLAAGATKLGVATTLGVLVIAGGTTAVDPGATATDTPAPGEARTARLIAQHHCSETGFGPDVVPGSALVRRGSTVHVVSFDVGWATYTGARPGTLVAVCRDAV